MLAAGIQVRLGYAQLAVGYASMCSACARSSENHGLVAQLPRQLLRCWVCLRFLKAALRPVPCRPAAQRLHLHLAHQCLREGRAVGASSGALQGHAGKLGGPGRSLVDGCCGSSTLHVAGRHASAVSSGQVCCLVRNCQAAAPGALSATTRTATLEFCRPLLPLPGHCVWCRARTWDWTAWPWWRARPCEPCCCEQGMLPALRVGTVCFRPCLAACWLALPHAPTWGTAR